MRAIWLEKIDTKAIWNCLPDNPYSSVGGCFFASPSGFGYQQSVTQKQVGAEYIVDKIQSSNMPVKFTAYFNGEEHLNNFVDFVGDFGEQMYLYYSPDGSIQPYDMISKPYYKPVTINLCERAEKNTAGFIVCEVEFTPQSDVWYKDVELGTSVDTTSQSNNLLYPYTYPYYYGGKSALSIMVENNGRETGCVVEITNNDNSSIGGNGGIEYEVLHTYTDVYGTRKTDSQSARFFVIIPKNGTLTVDSNALTQRAYVGNENVVSMQEPSWNYINFIRLKHGTNRLVFYTQIGYNITVKVKYKVLREVI